MSNNIGSTPKTTALPADDIDFVDTPQNNPADKCGSFLKHKVSVMDNPQISITCNNKTQDEKISINSHNLKFSGLRFIFKAIKILSKPFVYIGLFNKIPNVVIEKSQEMKFKNTVENNPNNHVITLNISDKILLQDIKNNSQSFTARENENIFNKTISPLDVKQNDYRSSCYLLSTLASYAASDHGRGLLKSMITTLGNTVEVTFLHEDTNTQFKITVNNTTLVDQSGNAIYSSSDDADTDKWCEIIEKAYHGLRLFLKKAIQDDNGNNDDVAAAIVDGMLGSVPNKNSLDYANSYRSVAFLPSLPVCSNTPSGYTQAKQGVHYIFNDNSSTAQQKDIENILENAKYKVPMNLNSRKDKTLQLAKQGIPTGHAMAVIGVATEQLKNGQAEQGILIYDPYGKPPPSKELYENIINGTSGDATRIDNAESCVKFIKAKDIPKYFAECVIAKGGFIPNSS